MMRVRWADGEFSACFAAHDHHRSFLRRADDDSTARVGVLERFERGFAIGGVPLRSQERKMPLSGSRRLRNGASFPHDARATLVDRGNADRMAALISKIISRP